MPATEIRKVVDTVLVRPDPVPGIWGGLQIALTVLQAPFVGCS